MKLVTDIRDITSHRAYRPVAPASRVPARPPPFLLGPMTAELTWEIFGQIDLPAVGCYALESATIAPTGIAIQNGVAFFSGQFQHPRHHVVTVSDRLNAESLPMRDVPGPLAVIYGPAHETWGHWLTDFLPRLWVLQAAGYDLAKLRFLLPPDLRAFARQLLELCGMRPEQCVTYAYWREVIRTDLLLMPTGLRAENRLAPCFAAATSWWTKIAGASTAPGQNPLLMLSRRGAPQERQMANRPEIEAMAQENGFDIVHPEDFSIQQQIALFSGARVIIGEYGSALHNSVFAGPGTLVCGLRGTSRHPSFVQTGIATALGQGAAYVFGDTGGQDVSQRFRIEPGLFKRALEIIKELRPGALPLDPSRECVLRTTGPEAPDPV